GSRATSKSGASASSARRSSMPTFRPSGWSTTIRRDATCTGPAPWQRVWPAKRRDLKIAGRSTRGSLMKSLPAAIAIAAAALAPAAYADCSYPPAPTQLPDGSTATLAQMLSAQKAVQAYNEEMNAYLSCIHLE